MAQVQVDRRVLWALGLGCGLALLGLAFALGRLSGPTPAPTPTPEAPARAQGPIATPSPAGTPDRPGDPLPVARGTDVAPLPVPAGALAGPAPDATLQRSVVAYFEAVDALQPGGLGGEPQALAQEIATGLGKGDSSGIDHVIQQTETVRQKLSSLQPPPPCAAHHKACLASLDDSLGLLRSLRLASGTSDASQLTQLTTSAQAMQARALALQKEDEALRKRYGLR